MDRFFYYLGCFIAVVLLEALPRFLFEVNMPFLVWERFLLLSFFLITGLFFSYVEHGKWRWGILSSMFFVDAIAVVVFAILLFMQLFSPWFMIITLVVIITRAAIFSYLVSFKLPQFRSLVFFTCLFLLVAGELVMSVGLRLL